jgi:molecular chaperone IbpA
MRNLDMTPLYRATVGFDRFADLMDRVLSTDVAQPTYPPYNIEKLDENAYRISVAVAGFAADELAVEQKENALFITPARRMTRKRARSTCTAASPPARSSAAFHLADHVKVTGATHADGMLHVDLVREMPEALKPRRIEIASSNGVTSQTVDA